jgi:succinate dehydrogenase/fumarate reductase cytochrome b subunit
MVSMSTWRQLQAGSGLVFGLFLPLHFLSHYGNIQSSSTGLSSLHALRKIYQVPAVEIVVFGSLILHFVSNINVYLKRTALERTGAKKKDGNSKKGAASPGALELTAHRVAGYILAMFITGHVLATRGVSLWILDDPGQYDYSILYRVAKTLPTHSFTIYLCVFGMAANFHFVYGMRSALATLQGHSVHNKPFPLILKPVALVMHLLIIAAVVSITGYRYAIVTTDKQDATFEAISHVLPL